MFDQAQLIVYTTENKNINLNKLKLKSDDQYVGYESSSVKTNPEIHRMNEHPSPINSVTKKCECVTLANQSVGSCRLPPRVHPSDIHQSG